MHCPLRYCTHPVKSALCPRAFSIQRCKSHHVHCMCCDQLYLAPKQLQLELSYSTASGGAPYHNGKVYPPPYLGHSEFHRGECKFPLFAHLSLFFSSLNLDIPTIPTRVSNKRFWTRIWLLYHCC